MQEASFPRCWKPPIPLVTDRVVSTVDSHNGNADRASSAAAELIHLISQIVDNAIDLLNHCLRQNLDLNADFNRCDWTTRHLVTRIDYRILAGDDFTEGSISPTRDDTAPLVLDIEYAIFSIYGRIDQFWRTVDCDEVLVQVHRNEITLI